MLNAKTLKIGDKVKVVSREALLKGEDSPRWNGIGFVDDMVKSAGKEFTVTRIQLKPAGCQRVIRSIHVAESEWTWAPHAFETKKVKPQAKAFKIGDRVIGIGIHDSRFIDGLYGVIVSKTTGGRFGVEFDNNISGHNCDGKAKLGHGWNCTPSVLKAIAVKDFYNGKHGVLIPFAPFADVKGKKVLTDSGEEVILYAMIPDAEYRILTNKDAYKSVDLYTEVPAPVVTKKMTLAQIEAKLGHKIEVVK